MHVLPPVLQLWLSEVKSRPDDSIVSLLVKDKSFRKDVAAQADARHSFPYVDHGRVPDGLWLAGTGSTVPVFRGTCSSRDCRLNEAVSFAETAAVYADGTIVVDEMSTMLADRSRPISASRVRDLAITTEVLHYLRPLLDAGIIRFAQPSPLLCGHCSAEQDRAVDSATLALLDELIDDVTFSVSKGRRGRTLYIKSSYFGSNESPGVYCYTVPAGSRMTKNAKRRRLFQAVRNRVANTCFETTVALRCGAVIGTNDKLAPAVVRLWSGMTRGATSPQWERVRRVRLPVLEGLSPEQIVELRHEAGSALPAFRKRVAYGLAAAGTDDESGARRLAEELRAEASELSAEFNAVNLGGVRRSGRVLTSAGLALTFYGLAQSPAIAATGMAALMAAAAHSLTHLNNAEGEVIKLKAKPAYVALVAERLRNHRHI